MDESPFLLDKKPLYESAVNWSIHSNKSVGVFPPISFDVAFLSFKFYFQSANPIYS